MAEPKVRFKRNDGTCYPAWIVKKFSESLDALNNNSFSRDMLNYDGGDVKNIHYGDILVKFGDICNIQDDNVPYVNDGVTIQKYAHLKDGDVILADTAEDETVGKAIEIYNTKNDVVISGLHTMACRPVEVFAPKYLGYYMNSPAFHDQLRPYMQGVKVTSISRSNIADAKLSFPKSSEEQQRIADFLSSVDAVIVASEKEVANLETQKKAVMKKIFSQEVRFKREDGSDFPEWEERKLGDLGKATGGVGFPEKYQGYKDLQVPFYKVSDMNLPGNEISMSLANNYVSDELLRQMKSKPFVDTAVIFAKVGAAVFLDRKRIAYPPFLVDNNMMVFTPSCNDIDFQFLYHWFVSIKLSTFAQTGALPSYNASDIETINVCYPCLEEQRLIADFLSNFDEAIAAAKKELKLWKELKKGLLQQMFV